MQEKIHDKDSKHHTVSREVWRIPLMAQCGGGCGSVGDLSSLHSGNDERFLEELGETLMAAQPRKMFILTSYDETFLISHNLYSGTLLKVPLLSRCGVSNVIQLAFPPINM